MSAITSSAASAGSSVGTAPGDKYQSMSSGDFLKVMFAELTRQDPLQPSETKDLLAQISTIRSIESNLGLADSLKTLVKQNEAAGAGNLVGQTVKGLDNSGTLTTGVVRSVRIGRDGTTLNLLDGKSIPMKDLQEILGFILEDPESAARGAGGASGDTGAQEGGAATP